MSKPHSRVGDGIIRVPINPNYNIISFDWFLMSSDDTTGVPIPNGSTLSIQRRHIGSDRYINNVLSYEKLEYLGSPTEIALDTESIEETYITSDYIVITVSGIANDTIFNINVNQQKY